MYNHIFACTMCDWESDPNITLLKCESCHSPIEVKYKPNATNTKMFSHLGIIPVLSPISDLKQYISLGEGNTPIISFTDIFSDLNISVKAKLEFLNPTGSFKDRGSAMMISMLKLCSSTKSRKQVEKSCDSRLSEESIETFRILKKESKKTLTKVAD